MMENYVKFLSIMLSMVIMVQQVQAAYILANAKTDDKTLTNQLNMPQHQHHQQQQQQQVEFQRKQQHETQHEPISSEDATVKSYESVRDEGLAQPDQSYDKNDDVATVVDDDFADSNFNAEDNDEYDNGDVEELKEEKENTSDIVSRKKRELSEWFIAPNTRWCGRGNTANGRYNHLGGASAADKCCRKHDHCKMYIPAMSNRYELFNYRPYTLSHCSCDRRFRTCLKMANDEDAKTIGKLFFNMVQTQCFTIHKEEVCHKRAADGTCEVKDFKQKAFLRNNLSF